MNMIEAVKVCLKKAFTIQGRARRSEFWWFYLAFAIVCATEGIIDGILSYIPVLGWIISVLLYLSVLALHIPLVTAGIRRLHDVGKSGWWMLFNLTCCLFFIPVIFQAKAGVPGENEYGPNPKEPQSEPTAEPDMPAEPAEPVAEPEPAVEPVKPAEPAAEPVAEPEPAEEPAQEEEKKEE